MVKRSILIGSTRGQYFAIRTVKMNHSRTDLYSWKDIQSETFLVLSRNFFVVVWPIFLAELLRKWHNRTFARNPVLSAGPA